MNRSGHFLLSSITAFLLVLAAGCGPSEPTLVPVEGSVSVDGKNLETGAIAFHPDEEKGNNHSLPQPPVGAISGGRYTLATGAREGAPPGWYKVTVSASVPSDPKNEYSLPKLLVSKSFTSPATTSLSIEVKENSPDGSYDLKVTP